MMLKKSRFIKKTLLIGSVFIAYSVSYAQNIPSQFNSTPSFEVEGKTIQFDTEPPRGFNDFRGIYKQKLSLKAKNAPVSEVLRGVCKAEGINCDTGSFEKAKGFYISIQFKGTLGGFLNYLETKGLRFDINNGVLYLEGVDYTANESPEDTSELANIKVSLNVKDTPVKEILKLISMQTGYLFIPQQGIELNQKVDLFVVNKPLSEVLKALLLPLGYGYKVEGTTVKIVKNETRVFTIPRINYQESVGFVAGGSGGQKNISITSNFWQELEDNLSKLISSSGKYAINKEEGIVIVSDKPEVLDRIEEYIKSLKTKVQEICKYRVGIYEITYSKGTSTGFDFWRTFYNENNKEGKIQLTANSGIVQSFLFSYSKKNPYGFSILLKALAQKGKVKAIYDQVVSSVCGDTVAILPSEAFKYLEKVEIQQGFQSGLVSKVPVFNTLLLGPQVYITMNKIDKSRYEALVNITDRYIKSFKTYTFDQNTYSFPERVGQNQVSLTSIIRKGQIQIIAGFKHRKKTLTVNGVPILMDIPIIGNLFKGKDENKFISEYLILIQPY